MAFALYTTHYLFLLFFNPELNSPLRWFIETVNKPKGFWQRGPTCSVFRLNEICQQLPCECHVLIPKRKCYSPSPTVEGANVTAVQNVQC